MQRPDHRCSADGGLAAQPQKGGDDPLRPVVASSETQIGELLQTNNLISSMSRRGNCHDNAVAESFVQLLKRERIRRKTYGIREEARSDQFDYIEMFYNQTGQSETSRNFLMFHSC